jgi:hypothetical protein
MAVGAGGDDDWIRRVAISWLAVLSPPMKLQLKCDNCGKIDSAENFVSNYDGIDLCPKCDLELKIKDLKHDRDKKQRWLDETHLKDLHETDVKILELETELAKLLR